MKFPNKERILFLDIEGHRNSDGGFDPDMFELIKDFSLGFLMAYLTELHTPLMRFKNKVPQTNNIDIFDELQITSNNSGL